MNPISSLNLIRPFRRSREETGFSLVAMLSLMAMLASAAVIGATLTSMHGHASVYAAESAQALGIAQAGLEWFTEQLENDTDWTNEATISQAFAGGTFTITINSASATQVTFSSLGSLTGPDQLPVERQMTITVQKLPPAFLFALYQGSDTGTLTIRTTGNPCLITGDVWSSGSVSVLANNIVAGGKIYIPNTKSVSGAGSYTSKQITSPFPSMPQLNASSYQTLMDSYDSTISTAVDAGDCNVNNETLTLNGNTVSCPLDFQTNGNAVITGHGTIVGKRNVHLHDSVTAAQTLTITPSGGEILFLSARDIVIGDTSDPVVTINSGCRFYAKESSSNNDLINIHGQNTALTSAKIYARRRIVVQQGADALSGSLLFIDAAPTTANNLIQINGSGGGSQVNGSLLSYSIREPSIRLINGAAVTGLVYARSDGSNNGTVELNDCTVTGTVVANEYDSNQVTHATITYNASALPATIPEGFQTLVVKKPNSWNGL